MLSMVFFIVFFFGFPWEDESLAGALLVLCHAVKNLILISG